MSVIRWVERHVCSELPHHVKGSVDCGMFVERREVLGARGHSASREFRHVRAEGPGRRRGTRRCSLDMLKPHSSMLLNTDSAFLYAPHQFFVRRKRLASQRTAIASRAALRLGFA
jgi:hypothetical protein